MECRWSHRPLREKFHLVSFYVGKVRLCISMLYCWQEQGKEDKFRQYCSLSIGFQLNIVLSSKHCCLFIRDCIDWSSIHLWSPFSPLFLEISGQPVADCSEDTSKIKRKLCLFCGRYSAIGIICHLT